MATRSGIITLTTDFGTVDGFVGTVKGVILSLAPKATIADISHEVPAFDVLSGAWILAASFRYFPAGTVHVAVVDPQVGSQQRRIAAVVDSHYFLLPDNGLLTLVAKRQEIERACVLNKPQYWLKDPSSTFHARDIFAPCAAHLLNGATLDEIGSEIAKESLFMLDLARVKIEGDSMIGTIVYIDHFGNLITNVDGKALSLARRIMVREHEICTLASSYSEIGQGKLGAIAASHGNLEIAAGQASAAAILNAKVGMPVRIEIG
ncbi:MAG TPA: SAM-dependent chlorinase/fluorinase [Candidatus Obscuribacterales bacterium]